MKTEDYYNKNAEEFMERTFNLDMSETLQQFTNKLLPGAKVLDVGCGSGRDTLTLKSLGYEVTAFDGSEELVKLASQKINHPIIHMKIEDMNWKEEFDGVWAMASLLHLKKDEMPFNLKKIMDALKPDGTFFLSLKAGEGEGLDSMGRFFSYYSTEEVTKLFKDIGYENIEFFSNEDGLKRDVVWISALVTKTPELNLESKKSKSPKR
jgi:SAM-dependent methyltransferase